MKIDRNRFFCLFLLSSAGLACASPQRQLLTPESPAAPNLTTQNPTTQNPTTQNPAGQNPATQNPTTQNPATPNPVPPVSAPAPQQPAPDQPTSTAPIVVAPPELPKYPDVRLPGEYGFWIGLDTWSPKAHPIFNQGRNSGLTVPSYTTLLGNPNFGRGAEFGAAVGLHNSLTFNYLETRAAGDFTTPTLLTVAGGQTYTAGTVVSTDHNISQLKLSFNYLTWPYPVESRKFRLKTLYQVQYVSAKAGFDAPLLPLVDANGNIIVDSSGNPISYASSLTKWFVLPTFGASATEYITRNIRFEFSGDGFGIPHHALLYEAESTLNVRINHFELRGGGKFLHFKTSPNQEFYLKGTLASVFVGIRWYSR